MKHTIYVTLCCLMIISCGTTRIISENQSIKTEVKRVTVYLPDTVHWSLPSIKETNITRDSSSILENKYAISRAAIKKDGTLQHSLETKAQDVEIDTEKTIEYRDSVITKEVEITKEVPAQLNSWHYFQIYGFWALLALFLLIVLIKCRKLIARLVIGV